MCPLSKVPSSSLSSCGYQFRVTSFFFTKIVASTSRGVAASRDDRRAESVGSGKWEWELERSRESGGEATGLDVDAGGHGWAGELH